jgi:hypothetical protein
MLTFDKTIFDTLIRCGGNAGPARPFANPRNSGQFSQQVTQRDPGRLWRQRDLGLLDAGTSTGTGDS